MKKVAVILSGCGYLDGAEIREAVLALLALDNNTAEVRIFAPNKVQHHVLNHLSGEETAERRNILVEAARIARGKIEDINELNAEEFDGLVIPGGFGVAKNFSSFAFEGSAGEVDQQVAQKVIAFKDANKPIGATCISPAFLAMTLGHTAPTLTLGNDSEFAKEIEKLGAKHQLCDTHDCVIDAENKIVSTPAYMDDNASLKDVFSGIDKLVKATLDLMQ
ncbi:isoprenoid biosynthesis protein ElbB [Veronia nyctiphanis]|uniref:Glyoxalase n=1 Tax=Veronia nyctiphanis TaxID=1278244 RepID=A0A4Q0YUT6_9GAMM|nr:isoprenoid biosynthesis glyoxalase ElbB [Veronia nyctiphanis]RXJ73944.1 isoprenoid biosynthesis protein ElbB [Veronia nyctiphanis]